MPNWLTSASPDAVWATILALVLIGSVILPEQSELKSLRLFLLPGPHEAKLFLLSGQRL